MATSARRSLKLLAALAVGAAVTLQGIGSAAAVPAVGLGVAEPFAVLAGTPSVDNTGLTTVNGSLGIDPAVAVNGFGGPPNGTVAGGTIEAGTVLAGQAKAALDASYLNATLRADTQPTLLPALDGKNLLPGVHSGGALGLGVGGVLTLDGGGDPDAVFIIRASSTLITLSGSSVVLTGQAQACNVFWQVTSSATLGTNSLFVGTIMALSDIQAQTGATIAGRLLARNGQVTLDRNTITRPVCAAAIPPPVPPAQVAPVPTTTTSSTTSTTSTTVARTTTTTSTTVAPTSRTTGAVPPTVTTLPGPVTGSGAPGGPGVPASGGPGTPTGTPSQPELPRTGGDLGNVALVAVLATMAGVLLLDVSRRRRDEPGA